MVIRLDKMRRMDFCLRRLPRKVRKEIMEMMRDINFVTIEYLVEKPEGYPGLRMCGYDDNNIASYIARSVPRFEAVNQLMVENNCQPVFADPTDTYRSACEYQELMSMRPIEELEEEFGATFEDYM